MTKNLLAAVLFCGGLAPACKASLTASEWHSLNAYMLGLGFDGPGALLDLYPEEIPTLPGFPPQLADRIHALFAVREEACKRLHSFTSQGVGLVGSDEQDYPRGLANRMGKSAPPFLYYAGNLQLASREGLSIAGSREIDRAGAAFASKIGQAAAAEGLCLVSGGARGTDTIAETAALSAGGGVVLYLAESLMIRMKRHAAARQLRTGKLCLLSLQPPDAPFSSRVAHARNRLIYLSERAAFIAGSSKGTGGTFQGASENLRRGLTPTFVFDNPDNAGNQELIRQGGIPLPADPGPLRPLIENQPARPAASQPPDGIQPLFETESPLSF